MNRLLQLALLTTALTATVAHAQRGGGGHPGGGPGGPGGMGMSGPGGRPGERGDAGASSERPSRLGPPLGPNYRWWDDKKASRTLSLRPEQQQHMDDIFDSNKGELVTRYNNLKTEENRLSSMSPADLADEAKVFAGIDRVAQARAELEKENAHILLQIRKELDPTQLSRLDNDLAQH